MKSFFLLSLLTSTLVAAPVAVDDLVHQVLAQNPELRFYAAEIDAAKAAARSAGAPADPELSVSLGRKRVHDSTGILAGEGTAWSVSVAQTFEWPGRLALRKSIANRQIELAELGLAQFQAGLAARTRKLVFGLQAAQQNAAATAEVAARYRDLRDVFLQRDPAGLTPLLETRVLEAQQIALQRRADEAALALHAATTELNQLRGAPLDTPVELLPTPVATPARAVPSLPALLAAAEENNFEFRAKRLELEQQGLAVSLARHERRPAVTVSPFLSQESTGERERTFGIGVTVPLAVTARTGAAVAASEARRRQAEAALLVAQRELERSVTVAVQTFTTRQAALAQWQPDAAEKFREAAALADRHYRLGAVPLATYVELQNSYLDAVESLLATQRDVIEAGRQLELLTGVTLDARPQTEATP